VTVPDPVAVARRYVALSNAHDLDAIFPLLAEDAVYHSDNVGSYEGRAAIAAMMTAFFAARPDVSWEVAEYRAVPPDGAEFDFVAHAGGATRRGRERIFLGPAGLIRRVDVAAGA